MLIALDYAVLILKFEMDFWIARVNFLFSCYSYFPRTGRTFTPIDIVKKIIPAISDILDYTNTFETAGYSWKKNMIRWLFRVMNISK